MVTAAELLSVAAFDEGRYAQAFPSFGSERTGAPVVSFCRISGHPIRSHEPVDQPDGLILQDPTLLHQIDVFAGLAPDGVVLVNTGRSLEELGLADLPQRVLTVPATEIARRHVGKPLPNAALLGGFVAATGLLTLDGVMAAIRERFPAALGDANAAAAAEAYEIVERERVAC